jgi:hypothetical protein
MYIEETKCGQNPHFVSFKNSSKKHLHSKKLSCILIFAVT